MSTDNLKHYHDDWAKAKVHTLLGEMLDQTLLTFRKPKDVHVLHFPGIDAAETRRVYLARGIPPQNITSLERDSKRARAIESLGLGIAVRQQELREYIQEVNSGKEQLNYQVVSLDFEGPVSPEIGTIFFDIFCKNTGNHLLFHCANLLRRDSRSYGAYCQVNPMLQFAKQDEQISLSNFERTGNFVETQSLIQGLHMFNQEYATDKKSELKRTHYPYVPLSAFVSHANSEFNTIIRFCYSEMIGHAEEKIIETFQKMFWDDARDVKNLEQVLASPFSYHPGFTSYLERIISQKIFGDMKNIGVNDPFISAKIECALFDAVRKNGPFIPRQNMNYSYISESGAPMIGSIFYASRSRRLYEAAEEVTREIGFPKRFQVREYPALRKAYNKYLKCCAEASEALKGAVNGVGNIQFLGNASKPVLTKKRFIQELEAGHDTDYVRTHYRGLEGKPLPQWLAHWRMNTYKSKDMVEESDDDSRLERITEEQAYDFLASNIPPQEIWEAYPTSFTLPQLRGFKAQLTKENNQRGTTP